MSQPEFIFKFQSIRKFPSAEEQAFFDAFTWNAAIRCVYTTGAIKRDDPRLKQCMKTMSQNYSKWWEAYQAGEDIPWAPPRGFKIAESRSHIKYVKDTPGLAAQLCVRTEEINGKKLCYPKDWQPSIQTLLKNLMGDNFAALDSDTGTQAPENLLLVFPDGNARAVFFGCRPHSCVDANAYLIVDIGGRTIDVIWKNEKGIQYFGKDVERLQSEATYTRINQYLELKVGGS